MNSQSTRRRRSPGGLRRGLGIVAAGAVLLMVAACGGTTGNETSNDGRGTSTGEEKPLIYGVFATPLEEPWDGAIHAALTQAAADGASSTSTWTT